MNHRTKICLPGLWLVLTACGVQDASVTDPGAPPADAVEAHASCGFSPRCPLKLFEAYDATVREPGTASSWVLASGNRMVATGACRRVSLTLPSDPRLRVVISGDAAGTRPVYLDDKLMIAALTGPSDSVESWNYAGTVDDLKLTASYGKPVRRLGRPLGWLATEQRQDTFGPQELDLTPLLRRGAERALTFCRYDHGGRVRFSELWLRLVDLGPAPVPAPPQDDPRIADLTLSCTRFVDDVPRPEAVSTPAAVKTLRAADGAALLRLQVISPGTSSAFPARWVDLPAAGGSRAVTYKPGDVEEHRMAFSLSVSGATATVTATDAWADFDPLAAHNARHRFECRGQVALPPFPAEAPSSALDVFRARHPSGGCLTLDANRRLSVRACTNALNQQWAQADTGQLWSMTGTCVADEQSGSSRRLAAGSCDSARTLLVRVRGFKAVADGKCLRAHDTRLAPCQEQNSTLSFDYTPFRALQYDAYYGGRCWGTGDDGALEDLQQPRDWACPLRERWLWSRAGELQSNRGGCLTELDDDTRVSTCGLAMQQWSLAATLSWTSTSTHPSSFFIPAGPVTQGAPLATSTADVAPWVLER